MIRPLTSVDLPVYAGIPKEYIPNDQMRLNIYRRMADIQRLDEVEQLELEFTDRFGQFGEDLTNLFWLLKIRILAAGIGLSQVALEGKNIVLRFPPIAEGKSERKLPDLGKTTRIGKNAYWLPYRTDTDWQENLMNILIKMNEKNPIVKK